MSQSLHHETAIRLPSRIRATVKTAIPRPVKSIIQRWRANQVQRQYAALSLADTFDRIYQSNAWGGAASLPKSGTGSADRYVDAYCQLLRPLLKAHGIESVADLGCGDFNTGRAVAGMVREYTGVDISQRMVDANARQYGGDRIRFIQADLTRDPLPPAGAAILRQVLQHLTNAEVMAVLDNVLRTYALAIVTEHIYTGRDATPNLDIAHGPGTRVPAKSGVYIDRAPFSRQASPAGDIPFDVDEVLRTWVVSGTGAR